MPMRQVVDRLDELPEVNREQVEEAGKELADAAVKVLAQGLRLPNQEVKNCNFVSLSPQK